MKYMTHNSRIRILRVLKIKKKSRIFTNLNDGTNFYFFTLLSK